MKVYYKTHLGLVVILNDQISQFSVDIYIQCKVNMFMTGTKWILLKICQCKSFENQSVIAEVLTTNQVHFLWPNV